MREAPADVHADPMLLLLECCFWQTVHSHSLCTLVADFRVGRKGGRGQRRRQLCNWAGTFENSGGESLQALTSPSCTVQTARRGHSSLSLGNLQQAWIRRLWATLFCWPSSPSSVWSKMVRMSLLTVRGLRGECA